MSALTPIGWRAWVARAGIYKGPLYVEQQAFGTWAGARLWCEQGRALFPNKDDEFCASPAASCLSMRLYLPDHQPSTSEP
jgi:hypothetical protein